MNKIEQLIKESISEKVIYLDMDGVLCDFDKQTVRLLGDDEVIRKFAFTRKLSATNSRLNKIGISDREEFYQKLLELREECINQNDPFDAYNKASKKVFGFSVTHNIIRAMGTEFWSTMDWEQGGQKLVKEVLRLDIHTEILTAGKGSTANIGKQEWLSQNNLGNLPFNIVERGLDKGEYANPNKILIDDKIENINEFTARGGIGIHHYDANNTIKILQSLI
jgi:hypothetical protein